MSAAALAFFVIVAILGAALAIVQVAAKVVYLRTHRRYRRGELRIPTPPPAVPVVSRPEVPMPPEDPLPRRPMPPREDVAREVAREFEHRPEAFQPDPDTGTIYGRYNGRDNYRAIVTDLYDRLTRDPALAGPGQPFYGLAAESRARLERHMRHVLNLLTGAPDEVSRASWEALATGSPARGKPARDLGDVLERCHSPLGITTDQYDRTGRHVADTLRAFNVDDRDIVAILQQIERYRPRITQRIAAPPATLDHPPM